MKKAFSILAVFMMFFLVASLVSCGGDNNPESGNNNDNYNNQQSLPSIDPLDEANQDKLMLEGKGYTVTIQTTGLGLLENVFGVEAGSLKVYLTAIDSTRTGFSAYYFVDFESAKQGYDNAPEQTKPTYKLKDNKVYIGDTKGMFD